MPWNTFDRDRKHLEAQYHDPDWDVESGWSFDRLHKAVELLVEDALDQPRILTKARVFELILLNGRIHVDPKDWFCDHLQHGDMVRKLRDRWTAEINSTVLAETHDRAGVGRVTGAFISGPNFSHTSPDWERLLALGPSGLLDFVRKTRQKRQASGSLSEAEVAFYDAVETVYTAFIQFILRLAEGAEKQAALHEEDRARMLAAAECLRNIATRPPETLHEAMQLAHGDGGRKRSLHGRVLAECMQPRLR